MKYEKHTITVNEQLWRAVTKMAEEQGLTVSKLIEQVLLSTVAPGLKDIIEREQKRAEEEKLIKAIVKRAQEEDVHIQIAPVCSQCGIVHRCKECGTIGYWREYSIAGVRCIACDAPIRCERPIISATL